MKPTSTSLSEICPDIGAWRAWLDHEAQPDRDFDLDLDPEKHLAGCLACRSIVAELRDDAQNVNDLFTSLAPSRVPDAADIALARERLEWRRAQPPRRAPFPTSSDSPQRVLEPLPMFLTHLSTPWRIAASGIAAAIALALIVAFTPQGNSAAYAFLAQFRSQQVTAVEVTPQSYNEILKSLNSLNNLGTVHMPSVAAGGTASPQTIARAAEQKSHTATLAEAGATLGFSLSTPDAASLPGGLDRTPTIDVTPGSEVSFTFDKNKARTYYESTGHPGVTLPDKFDGTTLRVSIPSAAVLQYGGGANSKNELMVIEAGELVVETQGNASLPEMRDFLLGLPGLPPSVVAQLKNIQSWNDTLPIPVPVDQVHWENATINGAQGLLLNDNSGVGSAAVWHANGHLYGLAGSLKANDLKRIADTMAVR